MRTTAFTGMLLLALFAAPVLMAQEAEGESEKTTGIQWTEDYSKALETAKAEKKNLFIEFTATW